MQFTFGLFSFLPCATKRRSDTVYSGLELFQQGRRLQTLMEVPGVAEGELSVFVWSHCSMYA
jgi:hypothetical protein